MQFLHGAARPLSIGFLLSSLFLVLFGSLYAVQSWRWEKDNEWLYLSTIAEITGNTLNTHFSHLELTFQTLSEQMAIADQEESALDKKRIQKHILQLKRENPEFLNVALFNAKGRMLVLDNVPPSTALPDLADDPSFQSSQREILNTRRLTIARSLEGHVGQGWIMALRMGLFNRNGQLSYIFTATIPLLADQGFWKRVTMPAGGSIGILRDDAYVVSRYPTPAQASLAEVYGKPRNGALVEALRRDNFPARGQIEGYNSVAKEDYLFSYYRFPDFPLTVFVTRPVSSLHAKWLSQMAYPGLLLAILLTGGLIATRLAIRRLQTQENQQAELRQQLEAEVSVRTQELREAKEEAERLSRVKGEFLANMSHEIRTPLNGIIGMAHLGSRHARSPERAADAFAKILRSGNLLLGIVNDILDFSKVEAGRLSISQTRVNLPQLLRNITDMVGESAVAKDLALELKLSPDLPDSCLSDPLRIQQMLVNLLSNAVKFTEKGSIQLRAQCAGGQLVFQVTDTGIGMNTDQLARVFEPFEQADGSTTRKFGGTGLGLTITARIAGLMDGSIQATSTPGVGSSFEIRLPYIAPMAKAPINNAEPQMPKDRPLAGLRILVAEDNDINQEVILDNLTEDGAEATLVENGLAALEAVRQAGAAHFHAVLMDIQMPVMNGLDATRAILAIAPELPIIGQTAHAYGDEREACFAVGMVDHIAKPIDPEGLVATLLRHTRPDSA